MIQPFTFVKWLCNFFIFIALLQANLNNISSVIRHYFSGTPILESVGNHEGVPMDASVLTARF